MEWLLYLGILTFFLWPFIQLWSIQAIPLIESDMHQKASIALENLMEEALASPFMESQPSSQFAPISGDNPNLEGKVEIMPHPDIPGLTLVRATVRWGILFLKKNLMIEAAITRTRS